MVSSDCSSSRSSLWEVQALQYRQSHTFTLTQLVSIWLIDRRETCSAVCDCLCYKYKVEPDIVEWKFSGKGDTHSCKIRLSRNGSYPQGCKFPVFPLCEQWSCKNASWHHSWQYKTLVGEAGVVGMEDVPAGHRNLWPAAGPRLLLVLTKD